MFIIKTLLSMGLLVLVRRRRRQCTNKLNNRVDYIDEGCNILKVDYQFFKKDLF